MRRRGRVAALPALAAAAADTSTLHVGTSVTCTPLRNPAQLALDARTMCELIGDRFELGLGAGRPGAGHDAAALGIGYRSLVERVDHLADTVRLLREHVPGLRPLLAASGLRLARLAGAEPDMLLRHRDALGVSYVTIPAEAADAFAPLVELLAP